MTTTERAEAENAFNSDRTVETSILRSGHDRTLGLRGKLEYYYREAKRVQQEREAEFVASGKQEKAFYLELIQVADSFEDVFRMFEESRKLKKKKEASEYFRTTYDVLVDALERQGVFQVEVLGKTYDGVEYKDVPIREPWTVVGVEGKGEDKESKKAKKVQRNLWVQVKNDRLEVLRRAQVTY